MKEWFLSTDLIGMDTMPNTLTGVSQKARRENWKSRKATGGGRSLEYHISNFDECIIQQLQKKFGFTDSELIEVLWPSDIEFPSSRNSSFKLYQAIEKEIGTPAEIIAQWDEDGTLAENVRLKKQALAKLQPTQSSQPDYIYNFLGKFINSPVEEIKKLESEGKLINKLDEKLHGIEFEQQELKTYKEKDDNAAFFKGLNLGTKPNSDSYVKLDYYDIEVSAGHGALIIQEDQSDCITFSRKFIDNEIGVNVKNVFLMPVRGDSMAPTLKNQAIIMINRIEEFSGDGVYVFRFDSQLMVKRLQFTKTGLNVVSDNTTYEPWQLTREELTNEDFEIIGEVVWSGQRL